MWVPGPTGNAPTVSITAISGNTFLTAASIGLSQVAKYHPLRCQCGLYR
jgi:hypothetical protein